MSDPRAIVPGARRVASRRVLLLSTAVATLVVAIVSAGAPESAAGAPAPPAGEPEPLVRLAWVDDPATTMTVRWEGGASGAARVRAGATSPWTEVDAVAVPVPSGRTELEVTFTGLAPATTYQYAVTTGVDGWSVPADFRTAGSAPGEVVAAFVADTGIAGRLDGLATGTEQVVAELERLDVDVVLGGGDYAYFDTDIRFATQDDAIDAWLSMMQPVLSGTPFMPAYGNHETLLGETVDRWVARFPTPEGDTGRMSYSFDVAGVHFVSLHAFEGKISDATFAWLAADLDAAVERGVQTIVPYLHRNVYGDGTAHPPSPSLGRQLSGLFEQYPVDVVLTAHDQSYERTLPLRGGDPTTTARSCSTRDDGIVWVKSSPGGKVSSVTSGFSGFSADPPSPQVAVREGGLHHVTVVTAGTGGIDVVTYGLTGDGATPIVVDRFERRDECAPGIEWATQPISLAGDGTVVAATASLSVPAQDVTLTTSEPWLTATADPAGAVAIAADTAALPPGTHAATIAAAGAGGGRTVTLPVVVGVPHPEGGMELVLSGPDRTATTPLDGATVGDEMFVELRSPFLDVHDVTFSVDGVVVRSESDPPFDLGGGSVEPRPFDVSGLSDGVHVLEATAVSADGNAVTVSASFTVDNATAPAAPAGDPSEVAGPSGDAAALAPPVSYAAAPVSAGTAHRSPWWASPWWLIGLASVAGVVIGVVGRRRSGTVGRPPGAEPEPDPDTNVASEGYVTR